MDGAFWSEEPCDLTTWFRSERYMGHTASRLSAVQYYVIQVAEKILPDEAYAELARSRNPKIARYYAEILGLPRVNHIIVECGQGSGKDLICRLIFARLAYVLSCLRDPQQALGLASGSRIHWLNTATNSVQATNVFFSPLADTLTREGSWFQRWFASRPKAERAGVLQHSVRFGRGLEAISGHSEAGSQQGLNLLVGLLDEADDMASGKEIWDLVTASGASRFPGD